MSRETVPVAAGLVPATEHVLMPPEIENDRPQEACGVVAVWSEDQTAPYVAYTTLEALQHRGRDGAGVSFIKEVSGRSYALIARGLGRIAVAIDQSEFEPAVVALGHARYGTSLATLTSETTSQEAAKLAAVMPLPLRNKQGDHIGAVAHNGQFHEAAIQALALQYGVSPQGTDSTIFRNLLESHLEHRGGDMETALKELLPQLSGSFCLTIMTQDAVYGVKDTRGIRPLWYGESDDGQRKIIASERVALLQGGVTPEWEVDPGTYVVIDKQGVRTERWAEDDAHPCVFEAAYFLRPGRKPDQDSVHHGLSAQAFRRRMGTELALGNPDLRETLDIAVPVLGSGRYYAEGFAQALGVRYVEALEQVAEGRSFIGATQADREAIVWDKLRALTHELSGKRVAAVDDSVVRGTTSRITVEMLRRAGAAEVTLVSGMPRIEHPCDLGMAFRSHQELLAHNRTLEEMRLVIGADRLIFPTIDMLKRAAAHLGQSACMGCMTGQYPNMSAPVQVASRMPIVAAS